MSNRWPANSLYTLVSPSSPSSLSIRGLACPHCCFFRLGRKIVRLLLYTHSRMDAFWPRPDVSHTCLTAMDAPPAQRARQTSETAPRRFGRASAQLGARAGF